MNLSSSIIIKTSRDELRPEEGKKCNVSIFNLPRGIKQFSMNIWTDEKCFNYLYLFDVQPSAIEMNECIFPKVSITERTFQNDKYYIIGSGVFDARFIYFRLLPGVIYSIDSLERQIEVFFSV